LDTRFDVGLTSIRLRFQTRVVQSAVNMFHDFETFQPICIATGSHK